MNTLFSFRFNSLTIFDTCCEAACSVHESTLLVWVEVSVLLVSLPAKILYRFLAHHECRSSSSSFTFMLDSLFIFLVFKLLYSID